MKIEHVGLWVQDLEAMKKFYETYLEGIAGELYHNQKTNFKSYFLTFLEGDTRLELMNKPELADRSEEAFGYAHLAYQVADKNEVEALHQRLVQAGYKHVNGPRTTGDGYYEAVIEDPEGNLIEITA